MIMTPLFLGGLGVLMGAGPTNRPLNPTPSALLLVDLFVDAGANCAAGNGSAASPFCTIGDAVAVAVSGDVIRIAGGTYAENLFLGANVALIGTDGKAVTTLDGGLNGTVVTVLSGADVAIDGLTITRGSESGIVNRGQLLLTNSTVSGNSASTAYGGGGIYHDQGTGTLTLRSSTVSGNSLTGNGYYGGGVYGYGGGGLFIEGSTVSGNAADYGGGVYAFGTDLTISSSTISGNTAGYGGGVVGGNGDMTVINSTISGNSGGGILFYGDTLTLRSTTIVGSTGGYGGVANYGAYAANIAGTVAAGSTNAYYDTDLQGDFVSAGFNFVGSAYYANGITNGVNGDSVGLNGAPLDPMLGPLANNGGSTMTHQPMGGSPLISAGDQVNFEPLDQRGAVRVAGTVDIGSTEDTGGGVPGCTSVPNSTGSIGAITSSGSVAVIDDNFTLTMSSLPANQFGIFLIAPQAGFQPNPGGSTGNLCLAGSIGRFFMAAQIMSSGPAGAISLQIPLTMLPQGNGFIAAQPGDTWFFQGWHRDVVAGVATSNFSSATGVLFN